MSVVVCFVEDSDDHQLFIAAALLEDGEVRHVHRKLFLPNYGLFDERRFFAAGTQLRAVDSRLGVRLGMCVCEDFWHLATPHLLALDGAQMLVNISSSPGRDVAAADESGLGTATSWRTLMRAYAQLTTSYVVFVNRVGVEETVTLLGRIAGRSTRRRCAPCSRRHCTRKGCTSSSIDLDDVRRERTALPLLRDERPDFVLRQLERIAARAGGRCRRRAMSEERSDDDAAAGYRAA